MSEAKTGAFKDLVEMTEQSLRPVIKRLRKIILEIDADACEVVRIGDRATTYGLGPKKMSEGYVYLMPHKTWVNLGFFNGADLKDPKKLMEGTGAKMRHVKIRSMEEADQSAVKTLIKAALRERRKALGR
ncbi:MAG: DUF1801 domain-containing protein [Planctomycetota bacterium]|jgi:hypothetical protein